MANKPPYVVSPTGAGSQVARPATLIFLHGYSDDAEGIPLGLAQQFQFHNKMEYLKWVLPNAPHDHEAMTRAWFVPKALPNAMKPRVPGHDGDDDEGDDAADDEVGILKSVDVVDQLVAAEIDGGTPPDRILVGGFSQGCAVSLIWGLTGKHRNQVGGVLGLSGYLPLRNKIGELRTSQTKEAEARGEAFHEGNKKWFYVHGTRDLLVPVRLFHRCRAQLAEWVDEQDIDDHVYEGMGHMTCAAELRDMLAFFERVIPP